MITMQKYGSRFNQTILELVGLSTDIKPTDEIDRLRITNGSTFYAIDTKKIWMFSEEDRTWYEM